MSHSFSFGKIQFDVALGPAAVRAPRDPEAPFLLAVLGDFTGRANRGVVESMAGRRPISVDCDNAEQVMARLGARLRLPSPREPGATMELRFGSMDDFHPDQLLKQAGPLAALVQVLRRLKNPATASAALLEGQRLLAGDLTPAAPVVSAESAEDTLARLIGGTPPTPPSSPTTASSGIDLGAFLKQIAAPMVVPKVTAEQSAATAAVEAELATQLRAILHHPEFQNLEAVWRGLDRLVREYGAEANLKLHLLDVTKEELTADLKAQENLEQAGLFPTLRDQPWAVWIGDYTFGDCAEEMEVLGRMANISARLGTAFVAGASPHLVGCDSLALHPDPDDWIHPMSAEGREAWAALRGLPEASHVGLALPRVMLRQPYGKGSDPIEAFAFEELAGDPRHESYLWGNAAFVCGGLLADAFRAEGWELRAGGPGEIDDLPVHRFTQDGETRVQPCAEVWFSERAGDRILSQGLMPLLSIKGRGAVRLANMQSAARPSQPLSLRQG